MSKRTALLVVHTGRKPALGAGRQLADRLVAAGMNVRVLQSEAAALDCPAAQVAAGGADGAELVIALGGDGTLLRAAEFARPSGAALLGVNRGHVGFLSEAERTDLEAMF